MFLTASEEKRHIISLSIPVICLSTILPLLLMNLFTPWLLQLLGTTAYLVVYELFFWGLAIAVLVIVLVWEREKLPSIGRISGDTRKY